MSTSVNGVFDVTERVSNMSLHGPDGQDVRFEEGDRISWADPYGFGGVTVTGSFAGALESQLPRSTGTFAFRADPNGSVGVEEIVAYSAPALSVVCFDVDPDDHLREVVAEVFAPTCAWWRCITGVVPVGLTGAGGKLLVEAEVVRAAVRHGRLVPLPRGVEAAAVEAR